MSTNFKRSVGWILVNIALKVPASTRLFKRFVGGKAIVVVTLGAAVAIALQFIGMNQFVAVHALEPSTEAIFLCGSDFYFWFFSRKQSH